MKTASCIGCSRFEFNLAADGRCLFPADRSLYFETSGPAMWANFLHSTIEQRKQLQLHYLGVGINTFETKTSGLGINNGDIHQTLNGAINLISYLSIQATYHPQFTAIHCRLRIRFARHPETVPIFAYTTNLIVN